VNDEPLTLDDGAAIPALSRCGWAVYSAYRPLMKSLTPDGFLEPAGWVAVRRSDGVAVSADSPRGLLAKIGGVPYRIALEAELERAELDKALEEAELEEAA
jgi:hypothetical protein